MDYNQLLNKNTLKILEVLREKQLYFSQIYEKTKIKSKNNILKNLKAMTELGILKKDKGKGNTFYKMNYDNLITISLLGLLDTMKLQDLPLERRNAITETVNLLNPQIAIVFGSTAKGNFKKDSDIDLLIVFSGRVLMKNVSGKVKKISSKYGVQINTNLISQEELKSKSPGIKHIIKTGFPVEGKRKFYEVFKNV